MQKPKILMVGDIPYWAYYYMSEYIIKELSGKYDFYVDYCVLNHYKRWNILRPYLTFPSYLKRKMEGYSYYVKYFHKRRILPRNKEYDLICFLGWHFPFIYDFKCCGRRIVQGIFNDGFPPPPGGLFLKIDPSIGMRGFIDRYLGQAVSVLCGSKLIYERYKPYVKNLYYCTGAIDTQLFKPASRTKKHKELFVVGWTGNPRRSFKGFYDFIVPAVTRASILRQDIVLKTRFNGPYSTLPKFYDDVDVLLIASDKDAGPSSFLEAGASAVPSISTKIGFPAEVIQDGKNGILVNRSVDEMVQAILNLHDDHESLRMMSENIRRDIENSWNPKSRSRLWDQMFEESLAR